MAEIRALIFGAGRGKRMRPLTDTEPKPLLFYRGRRLIDWQIDAMKAAGIRTFAVNTAHLARRFPETLGDGSSRGVRILYSQEGTEEKDALETLGGIAKALPLLSPDGETPFIAAAGDIVTEFDYSRLIEKADALLAGAADAHLILVPNPAFHPEGDMGLEDGFIRPELKTHTFASIGIYSPRIFRNVPAAYGKLFPWLYRFCGQNRVTGEVFEGVWKNIGTPAQLEDRE